MPRWQHTQIGIKSFQETMNSSNKVPGTDHAVVNIGEISDREFKTIVLWELSELG
jgi:hypothetical protein